MTLDEIHEAQELEYHLMGMEHNARLLPGPGWYACIIDEIYGNGDVEISFTSPQLRWLSCTVLKKNVPIAFRKKEQP